MALYLLDSNFFIQAHRNNYPLDVVPSFWIKLIELANSNKVISIDKVKTEIFKNEDDLKNWCVKNLHSDFFKDTPSVLLSYAQVINWAVARNHYLQKAIDEFLDKDEADAWLVSYAHANKLKVVTYETSDPNSKKKVKIPDACINFNIPYLTPIQMFRELGEKI